MKDFISHEEWESLRRLRSRFLDRDTGVDYWTRELLELYDRTLGQRILWKWENVLNEISLNEWVSTGDLHLVEWGSGTGIASRAFLSRFEVKSYQCWDRSALAREFTHRTVGEYGRSKGLTMEIVDGEIRWEDSIVIVSHVLSELSKNDLDVLLENLKTARMIIWVEPGDKENGQRLSGVREKLPLKVVAPCTHSSACPLVKGDSWCHFFGAIPLVAFQTEFWRTAATRLGIDLRSLPISFLVMDRLGRQDQVISGERVIGQVKKHSGHVSAEFCGKDGVRQATVSKGKSPELYQRLKDESFRLIVD